LVDIFELVLDEVRVIIQQVFHVEEILLFHFHQLNLDPYKFFRLVVQELEEDALLFVMVIFLSMIEPNLMLVTKNYYLFVENDLKIQPLVMEVNQTK
jgi:hypothetical protein